MSVAEENGQTLIVRTRRRAPSGWSLRDYPASIELVWNYEGSQTYGMPPSEVVEAMATFEDASLALEQPGLGLLGISITGNGRREWVWYVADPMRFSQEAQAIVSDRFPVAVRTGARR